METPIYILLTSLPYEGIWIKGAVQTLEEASDYFSKKIDRNREFVQRALDDNWENDYFSYWVEKWRGTQRICTYKYNIQTRSLVKQPKRLGDASDDESI